MEVRYTLYKYFLVFFLFLIKKMFLFPEQVALNLVNNSNHITLQIERQNLEMLL